MSHRYHVEDLLKLRESSLVCKPSTLPPQEEWMGSPPEATTRRSSGLRGKPDDILLQGEGLQKRPGLLDHQRKSTTASSELFLGPRKFGSGRKSIAQEEADDNSKGKEDLGVHEQTQPSDDTRERYTDRRSGRQDALNGRHSSRMDHGDDFQTGRYRRKEDRDDSEAKGRQETEEARDRPRWRARNGQEDQSAFEEEKDRAGEGRQSLRRDPQARAKFDQPWFRNDKTGESTGDRRNDTRQQEWRRDNNHNNWDRSGRAEADPEWMDSTEMEEPAQAHTQEDFERWKERMRAGGAPAEEKPQAEPKALTDSAIIAEVKKAAGVPGSVALNSPEMSDAMDKFYAKFAESKGDQDQKIQAKVPTKTRFAALWNAPAEPAPAPAPAPTIQPTKEKTRSPVQATSQADADQAGFARILQMLGSRSSNATPQEQGSQKPKTPLYAAADQQGAQDRLKSPDLSSLFGEASQQPRNRTGRTEEAGRPERIMDSRSPLEASHLRQESGPNKETSDILLNLMRQANLGQQPPPAQYATENRQPPGPLSMNDILNRTTAGRNNATSINPNRDQPMPQRRETGSSFFDEPPMSAMGYQDEQGLGDFQPNGPPRRQPTNGAPSSFYEEPFLGSLRQNIPQPPKPSPGNQIHGQGPPPGLSRPPGLDTMPRIPPGWPQQQLPPPPPQPQPPQQQRQAPPPGIPNLPRGMPAPFGNPNSGMPMPQHMQQQQQQPPPPNQGLQRPQRKYTGDSGPGFPPGMGPPPGFMNAGPPPGFPGAPQTYGRYQLGSEPPGMGRGFGEMYGAGQGERGMLRGGAAPTGNGMPGPYR